MKSKVKFDCERCHDSFSVDTETLESWLNGEIDRPCICDECFYMEEHPEPDFYEFSDADPGL